MKRLLLILFILFINVTAYSAYLKNVPVDLKQPDGTVIHSFITGDEYNRRVHDKDDYSIIQDPTTGYYVYAIKSGDKLISSGYVVGRSDPKKLPIEPNLDIPFQQKEEKRRERPEPSNLLKSAKIAFEYPTKGNLNNIVISIRFADQNPTTLTLQDYEKKFNSTTGLSLKSYFKEVSNSQLNITSYFFPTPQNQTIIEYQDSHPRAYYSLYNAVSNPIGYKKERNEDWEREQILFTNATEYVKNQITESSINIDANNDGYVDNIVFMMQGDSDAWADLLWPAQGWFFSSEIFIGSKQVNDYNKQLSKKFYASVLCHEFFHTLGAPDLYHYSHIAEPVGYWDLMGNGVAQHTTTYMKWKYGKWFDNVPEISQSGTYTLQPVSQSPYACYKIPSPFSATEYFMVEYRKKEGLLESNLLSNFDDGLIIYRINPQISGNAQGPPDELYIYRPTDELYSDGDLSKASFSSNSGRTTFNGESNPKCLLSNGNRGFIDVSNITSAGNEISFTVNFLDPLPTPKNLYATVNNNQVLLKWNSPIKTNQTLLGYNIFLDGNNSPLNTTLITDTTYTTTHPGQNSVYTFMVRAAYASGESDPVTCRIYSPTNPSYLDSLALMALYNQCDGPNWTKKANWLSGEPLKNWEGVTVENERVVGLYLTSVGLTGQFPSAFFDLTDLKKLACSSNKLSGTLPESFSKLVKLESLGLGHNEFTGSLPESWSVLVKLNALYLNNNQLTGQLPESWSSFVYLYFLGLQGNNLNGTLPDSWTALGHLIDMNLKNNQFSGILPESWSALYNLINIDLSVNQLSGSLPESWAALSNITNMHLGGNQFTGSLPESWVALEKLQLLDLSLNQLSGILPDKWSTFKNLNNLGLSNNQFSGILPESWSAFLNLTSLGLSYNQLSGVFPLSWSSLLKLQNINLSNNNFSETIPNSWSSLPSLNSIDISNNHITSLPDLSLFKTLKFLNVQGNLLDFGDIEPNIGVSNMQFYYCCQANIGVADTIYLDTGQEFRVSVTVEGANNQYQWVHNGSSIPSSSGNEYVIPSVVMGNSGVYKCFITNTVAPGLYLWSNPITLVTKFVQHPIAAGDSLALVALYNQCNGINWTKKSNWLTGRVDTWEGVTVENDRVVGLNLGSYLASVGLIGSIPEELSNLTMIRELRLNSNQLSGSLPDSWSALVYLQYLDMSSNQLSGTLPGSWSSLVNIKTLFLSGDHLTGSLPASWSTMVSLQNLDLGHNELTGSLPASWLSLMSKNLAAIQLRSNQLSSLPDLSQFTQLVFIDISGNLLDFGDIESNLVVLKDIYRYTPQTPVGAADTLIKKQDEEFRISVTVGGSSNSYQWYKNGASISGAIGTEFVIPSVSPEDAGIYTCQITSAVVTQLTLWSQPITLQIANFAPIANAGTDQSVNEGTTVTLDGSASSDSDGNPISYQWIAPSEISLNSTSLASPSFSAPEVSANTDYTFYLVVSDGYLNSPTDEVHITVKNVEPKINQQDSLALVVLYNATDGSNWTKKGNWLTDAVKTWEGVTVENGRVVGLNLATCPSVGLTGTLPAEISNLTAIKSIYLSNNQLSGSLPASWSALENLQQLDISNNKFSGSLPESWSALLNLNSLVLSGNQLTGTLPASWAGLTNLQSLQLSSNLLSGILPTNWSTLTNLLLLYLSGNQLTGTLPVSWSALTNIQVLYLGSNQISGLLPTSWSTLTNLQQLSLGNNLISGSLPDSWSDLVNLQYLELGYNQINGTIPLVWSSLMNLRNLFLYYNQLTGLPDLSSFANLNYFMVQGNLLDFGDIEPNIGLPDNFYYSSQGSIGESGMVTKSQEQEFRISVNVAGNSNVYQWFKNGVSITGATGIEFVIPSVNIDDTGIYTCQITNTIASELTLTSNPITLQVVNLPLLANAGPDQSVNKGAIVSLDGSASTAPDGNPLTYRWTAPEGIILNSGSDTKPTFIAPEVSTSTNYKFSLVVNDGTADSPSDEVVITVNSVIKVFSKVNLEGSYSSALISTILLNASHIPQTQPYSISSFNYSGTETVASVPANIVDWVLVELRQATSPELATSSTILAKRAAFLKSDDSVVDLDGTSPVQFDNATIESGKNLYVVVRHRNHLAIMSATGATLNNGVYSYDFTTGLAQAFGGGNGYKQVGTGKYAMVVGDVDQDGNIFVSDYNAWATSFGNTNGYLKADLDMDGNVFVSDYNKWAVNFGSTINAGLKSAPIKSIYFSCVPK